jgi:type II secretory pathway component PulM
MKILNNLSGWFAGLQPRERVIIALGAALLVVAAIYMALLPALQKNTVLEQRYKTLSEDMHWLREQSAVVSRLSNSCSGQALQSGEKKDIITRIARRNQLKLLNLNQDDPAVYVLTASSATPNQVLQFVHQMTCQGLSLETLNIAPSSDPKVGYSVDIEVAYVD